MYYHIVFISSDIYDDKGGFSEEESVADDQSEDEKEKSLKRKCDSTEDCPQIKRSVSQMIKDKKKQTSLTLQW